MKSPAIIYFVLLLAACAAPPTRMPAFIPTRPTVNSTLASSVPLRVHETRRVSANLYEYQSTLRTIDPTTGREASGLAPIGLGTSQYFALHDISADGAKLAAIESRGSSCETYAGGSACRGSADVLHMIDLRNWREITATLYAADTKRPGWVWPLAFSPDASRLALAYNKQHTTTLMLFDANTAQMITRQTLSFRPSLLAFTKDGHTLVAYGEPLGENPGMTKPDPRRLALLDATTLGVQWEHTFDNLLSGSWCEEDCDAGHGSQLFAYWSPAIAFDADRRKLYIVHADEDLLTTVDLDARAVRKADIRVARSWLDVLLGSRSAEAKGGVMGAIKQATLSPDRRRLYVIGRAMAAKKTKDGFWNSQETSLGLQVVDVETGRRIARRDFDAESTFSVTPSRISLSPDGNQVLVHSCCYRGHRTDVLDAKSLQPVTTLNDWEAVFARKMDGQPAEWIADNDPTN